MTIRFRNRMSFVFFFISITWLFLGVFFPTYQFFSNGLILPEVYSKGLSEKFLFEYKPLYTFIGIFILMTYVCITIMIIHHNFEKTQAPDIVYFLLFLFACLCDTTRILVPSFRLSGTFTLFLLKIGNIHLFARLLAPLALMGCAALSTEEFRQTTDRNCIILIIIAMFFAEFLPLNTAIILPNFCISYGHVKAIKGFVLTISIVSTIALIAINKKNEYKQIISVGFVILTIGYSQIFYCYNIAGIILGTICLGTGTFIYLNEVHKHYLWID